MFVGLRTGDLRYTIVSRDSHQTYWALSVALLILLHNVYPSLEFPI